MEKKGNFGRALKKLAASSLLLLPLVANAGYTLEEAYQEVNQQTARCLKMKNRPVDVVQDAWFDSLSADQKRAVLFELSKRAMDRCTLEQREKYSWALVKQAGETGDMKGLKDWIELNSPIESKAQTILNSLPEKEINRLSLSDDFYYPFDSMSLRDKLTFE
ncbi:hypothetical protein L4174_021205 [Photobacterium sp. CCB-ST2H9]|uniref:hypothetical protein n=1 Tax=Photobacterium sp. CCB-ST2H9 TaxID=2912855 RepID=UPI002004149D|nr:hypothetical protein [Photobacterium sp. CCB-ST2H9]UTM59228.1 hypothetical protein L4174_021205 [Photobacterium sp. CCB-ST2H9]